MMHFSRIRRLFGGEQHTISLQDTERFISATIGSDIASAKNALGAEISKAMDEYSKLRKLYAGLSAAGSGSSFPNAVKDRLCRRAAELLGVQEPPADHRKVIEFLRVSGDNLKSIGSISYKEMIHLYAFKEDMNRISAQTKILIASLNSLARENGRGILKEISKIEGCMERVGKDREEKNRLLEDAERIRELVSEKCNSLDERVASLEGFSALENEINEKKAQIEKIETEMNFFESRISAEFSGAEKILKSYNHRAREKGIIEDYIRDPTRTFVHADNGLEIRDILDRAIGQKERKNEKRLEKAIQLRRDLEILSSFRKEYLELLKKKEGMEGELLKLSSRASDKKYRMKDIQDTESEVDSLKRQLEEKEKRTEALDSMIKEDTAQLASFLRVITGENVSIEE